MKGKFRFRNLIIIVLCTIFVCGFIKQQSAMNRIKKETQEKTAELQKVKETNEKLTEEIDFTYANEQIARFREHSMEQLRQMTSED